MKAVKIAKKLKEIVRGIKFFAKYGFWPPPLFTDISGYEILLDTILKERVYELDGDFVEIGVFLGGGTYKISKLLEQLKSSKKLYAIDIFDPSFDMTICTQGKTMEELYGRILKGKDQRYLYNKTIKSCKNIVTIAGNSKQVELPCEKIAFAFIDGNHSPDYVKNDFYKVWEKMVSKGIVAFDDYGYDLPQVTKTIDELLKEEEQNILKTWTTGLKAIFIQKR